MVKLSNFCTNVGLVFSRSQRRFKSVSNFGTSISTVMTTPNRGALIVLEGCDRCGKTTQANMLVDNLRRRGHNVEYMRFPDRTTKVGSLISEYLKTEQHLEDHVIHLLFSANRWEMRDKIVTLIENQTTLIVDRYSFSGVAFSASKPGMDIEWCKQPEVGLPAPDMVIFLELDADVASRRGQFGDERYEDLTTQRKVRETYEQLRKDNWKIVDADKSVDQLQSDMLEIVENVILSAGATPMTQLWD